MIDPYKLLGVAYEATDQEIKKAYHALARKYHPDNFADDPVRLEMANRKMRDINAAYEQITADRARGIRGASAYATAEPPGEEGAAREQKKRSEARRDTRAEANTQADAGARAEAEGRTGPTVDHAYVRTLINGGSYAAALGELCRVRHEERDAEWHYLAGLSHLGMRHLHDAFREVNLACRRDRRNQEYKKTRDEMKRGTVGFGKQYERTRKKSTDVKVEGKPPRKAGFVKRCFLRAIGMEDGEC